MRTIYFLISLLSLSFCYSQNKIDMQRKNIFDSLEKRVLINAVEIYTNGKKMLDYAQTDYEFARSYQTLGDGKYKDGDFLSAIKFLEKADLYAQSSKAKDLRIAINSLLVYTYRYAGLSNESDTKLEIIKDITNKSDDGENAQFLQVTATAMEIDKNFCEAIPYRLKEMDLYQNHFKYDNIEHRKNELLIFTNVHMAFLKIKCGKLHSALSSLHIAEKTYQHLGDKKPTYLIENYYLVKALIFLSQKDISTSKKWFIKSYESAKITGNKSTIKKILTEMRESQIFDTLEEQNEIIEALLNLQNFQTNITQGVTAEVLQKKDLKLKEGKNNYFFLGSILISIILGLLLVLFYYRKRTKKRYANFKKILEDIENSKNKKFTSLKADAEENPIVIIKNNETEKFILKNLETFEKKNQFTTKGISLAQMAAILKTNTKYLSYILKKHRNSDFSNYINDYRINFIINELHSNPQLIQYKIAALAEMCGYTSHSQFANIFKAKKGISPSQFISYLEKK